MPLDEIMTRFHEQSAETHKKKNKPIACRREFFALATAPGHAVNFVPDGRRAEKTKTQEFEAIKETSKMGSAITRCMNVTSKLRERQKRRSKHYQCSACSNSEETHEEMPMQKLILGMVNCFTLPEIIEPLHSMSVGVAGAAHFKRD